MIKIEDILEEWDRDSRIDDNKLDIESVNTARLHAKYLQILSGVKVAIQNRKLKLEKLKHDKKVWMQGRMTKDELDRRGWKYDPFDGASKPMKGEMEAYVKTDPDVQKHIDEIERLQICQDALLDIMNNVNWRHQSIRNAIDFRKFMAGG